MPSAGYFDIYGANNLTVVQNVNALPDNFTLVSPLPSANSVVTQLSANALSSADFGSITAKFTGNLTVDSDATLQVAPGGTIALTAGNADVEGDLVARSGSISVEITSTRANSAPINPSSPVPPDSFNLTIGSSAVLDASGLWVNDSGADLEHVVGGAYVNGGAITLKTDTAVQSCQATACANLSGLGTTPLVDVTGNIVLQSGSHLDLSSGGRVGLTGRFQTDSNGRAAGAGGNLTLQTYATGFNAANGLTPTTSMPAATVILQGAPSTAQGTADALNAIVSAYGFESGGKLSIQAPSIQIVADGATSATSGTVTLPVPGSFFKGGGFGEYDLNAVAGGLIGRGKRDRHPTTAELSARHVVAGFADRVECRRGGAIGLFA